MIFETNINHIMDNKKFYFAPIINGKLEIETINYFTRNNFVYLSMPELDEQLFQKDNIFSFIDRDGTVALNSSQAMRITASSAIYGKVFTISKCFRKEKIFDNVHLSEFKALELEFQIENEEEIFKLIDDYLEYIVSWFNEYIATNKLLGIFDTIKISYPIERKEYEKLISDYSEKGQSLVFDDFNFCDMDITADLKEPLYVKYYPSTGSWRALEKDSKHAYLYNLILPYGYGELFEFSIRKSRYNIYMQKFEELGYTKQYQWYTDALKSNSNTRAGLGMGMERLGAWLMGLNRIGDQLLFPRYPGLSAMNSEGGRS